MAHDDPFTLDLFGNTALSSGLGLGVTAFGPDPGGDDDHDHDPPPSPSAPAGPAVSSTQPSPAGSRKRCDNFYLADARGLARTWKQRARDNVAAVRLASQVEAEQRPATVEEQRRLIRFTGFGASELANGIFRRPGETEFAKGWDAIGADLEDAVDDVDYASLARCTQYAHFTPEFIVRAIWAALLRLGWRGGRVLEPGIGTGLFPALMPEALRHISHVTGVESRSRHGAHRPAAAAAGADRHRRFRARRSTGEVRPCDRQSALLRSHRPLGSRAAVARPAAP
ncbi:N-6 DNA methylase (plasmid) [Bradyrhizobium guangxiense]